MLRSAGDLVAFARRPDRGIYLITNRYQVGQWPIEWADWDWELVDMSCGEVVYAYDDELELIRDNRAKAD